MTERGTVDHLLEVWPEGTTYAYSKDQFETIVKATRWEERDRIRRRLDECHVDYWDALDEDAP